MVYGFKPGGVVRTGSCRKGNSKYFDEKAVGLVDKPDARVQLSYLERAAPRHLIQGVTTQRPRAPGKGRGSRFRPRKHGAAYPANMEITAGRDVSFIEALFCSSFIMQRDVKGGWNATN